MKSIRGFSIINVMMAAGMMGGLALLLAQMTKQQQEAQKQAETGVEVTALSQRIVRTLYDGKACLKTLEGGTTPRIISATNSFAIDSILNKNGQPIIKTMGLDPNITYGNRLLKVSSIKLLKPVISGGQAEAELEVVMRRESSAYKGQKTIAKRFPLTLNLDIATSQLISCAATSEAQTQAVCTSLGGKWNGATGKCDAVTYPGQSCGAGEAMTGIDGRGDVVCMQVSSATSVAPGFLPGCVITESTSTGPYESWKQGSGGEEASCPFPGGIDGVVRKRMHSCSLRMPDGKYKTTGDARKPGGVCIMDTFCCRQ